MPGIHRREHVERFRPADLADDDPIRAHAQRVADEIANQHLALALDVRRPRLEPDHVLLLQLQLGGVLDGDDPLVVPDVARQCVEHRRLADAGASGDEDVELPRTQAAEKSGSCGVTSEPTRSSIVYGFWENFRIVSTGPLSDSGGMIAFTRLPSGRRASTMGEPSSIRRPTWETILSMIRSRCSSSTKAEPVFTICPAYST